VDTHDYRDAASSFLGEVLLQAFETVTVEEIETAFKVDFEEAMSILFEMGSACVAIYWDEPACTCEDDDPLAHVETGDEDPTLENDDSDVCSQFNGNWLCTRLKDHPGQHIAGDGFEVCAVWE